MILVGIVALGIGFSASRALEEKTPDLKTANDKVSYSIGVQIANSMKADGVEVNPDFLAQGMKDVFAGKKLMMDEDQMRESLSKFQEEAMKEQDKKMTADAEKNKQEGEAFLEKIKTEKGVVVLPSGLMYKVLKEGNGPKPKLTDTVKCHYRGTLISGKEFDSSYKRGEPASFPVNGVIAGWTEALQIMPVGSKWQLYIPSKLAYGERGAGRDIGPNSTLIFEIELLGIE